jgi:uncharacterized iron-regulated membrane protein
MGTFQQFWRQPQRLWLRKALFQIHLWSGIGAGLYVLLISVSGSVVVFRNEVYEATDSPVIIVAGVGERMNTEQILKAAVSVWPGYEVSQVYEYEDNPRRAVEVRLEKGDRAQNRLVDPYTGADLGPSVPWQIRVMSWFEDLHENLFGGRVGRQINAAGAVLWTVLGLTGMVVWWQGIKNWKRGLLVRMRSGWKRLNWDLHSSLGFWTLLLTLMWGATGVFVAIPDPFRELVDYVEPLQPITRPAAPAPGAGARGGTRGGGGPQQARQGRGRGQVPPKGICGRIPRSETRIGDKVLRCAYAWHFGNFAGTKVKIAWVVLGLAPALLFLTGFLMWINRVVRKIPSV